MLILGTPLVVVPWLGHRTSTAWVQSLVGKLSSHVLQLKKERKKEMQILGPHLKSTEVQTLGMGPSNLFQQQLSRWLMFPNIWEPGKEILLPSWGHGSVLAAPGSGAPRCQLAFSKSSPRLSPPLISHLSWSPYQPPCDWSEFTWSRCEPKARTLELFISSLLS